MIASMENFQNTVIKKVREDSKKLVMPTHVDALLALLPGVTQEELSANLRKITENEKFSDIILVKAFTDSQYVYSNRHMTDTLAKNLIRATEMKPVVADKVREDSRETAKPTDMNVFFGLIPELSTEELQQCYSEMKADERYQDITAVTAFSGAVYYYSKTSLDEQNAARLARLAELQKKIADKVRGDTKYLEDLTKMDALLELAPELDLNEVKTALDELMSNERYNDIEVLTARDGSEYLVSKKHMSQSYAMILLRTKVNDPAYTIAETVREESRVYPRPTNIELFKYGLFKMDREKLDEYIDQAMEEYEDLMLIDIEGRVFLYSNQYMTEEQAILVALKAYREN